MAAKSAQAGFMLRGILATSSGMAFFLSIRDSRKAAANAFRLSRCSSVVRAVILEGELVFCCGLNLKSNRRQNRNRPKSKSRGPIDRLT
jgi:hypothetical protein